MSDEQKILIKYRLRMAQKTLEDAQLLFSKGGTSWSVVNRAYYAMFYATLALLVSIGTGSAKHAGVITIFDEHFIKLGKLPVEMSKWLHKAFDLRQRSDYLEMYQLESKQVQEVLKWAQQFVSQVNDFLNPILGDHESDVS